MKAIPAYLGTLAGVLLGTVLSCAPCRAATRYVSTNGTHRRPFDTWTTAATNIQRAVDAAKKGDTVMVANGTYVLSSPITITNGITVRSLNGPNYTVVDGNHTCQCFQIDCSNSVLEGFTITRGSAVAPGTAGGGVAIWRGTVRNCIISNNSSSLPGGGYGGGILCGTPLIENSIIVCNRSDSHGGGVFGAYSGPRLRNVVVANNVSGCNGGGLWFFSEGPTASSVYPILENVTITGNVASNQGGAISTLGIVTVRLTNCIAWDNFPNDILPGVVSYSDVQGGKLGAGNIDDDPMFVSTNDWHLRAGSPCIDAGTNLASPVNDTDIDGQPRVFNDHVDMGADEAVIRAADFSVSNGVETVWDTVVDARCELQCCTNLVLANWYPASSILTCQQTVVTICDTQAINSCGFYRLRWHRP